MSKMFVVKQPKEIKCLMIIFKASRITGEDDLSHVQKTPQIVIYNNLMIQATSLFSSSSSSS